MKHLIGLLLSTGLALLILGIIWSASGNIEYWAILISFAVFLIVEAIIEFSIRTYE